MSSQPFIEQLKALGKTVLPKDASLWLYGSQARGETTKDSDWDLLILLNKEKREFEDFGRYAYPFTEIGFDNNEYVMPIIYTRKEWASMYFMPFAKNVEQDKIVLMSLSPEERQVMSSLEMERAERILREEVLSFCKL